MRLPLFPLDTVLFPGCILDLQLFEARYLDMISRCLKAGHGFGVVRILQGLEVGPAATAFAGIGCEAVIRDWQQQPNGLLGIRVEGQRRFDIERTEVQADQLIMAEVRWRPEPDDAPLDDVLSAEFVVRNEHGLHARPGTVLVNTVKQFNSDITVTNLDGSGKPANGRSLMKVVALGVKQGHRLRFTAQGDDAEQALKAIGEAIAAGLGEGAA